MSTTHSERFVAATKQAQRGLATVAAIFILVVLGGLGAFVVSLTTSQNINLAHDLESARAYQAARAGLEWGTSRWLNDTSTNKTCPQGSISFPDPNLSRFTAVVTGNKTTSFGVEFCEIISTAAPTGGAPGTLGYVERRLRSVIAAP
jgi:MSHA biogenesis protein MshP